MSIDVGLMSIGSWANNSTCMPSPAFMVARHLSGGTWAWATSESESESERAKSQRVMAKRLRDERREGAGERSVPNDECPTNAPAMPHQTMTKDKMRMTKGRPVAPSSFGFRASDFTWSLVGHCGGIGGAFLVVPARRHEQPQHEPEHQRH